MFYEGRADFNRYINIPTLSRAVIKYIRGESRSRSRKLVSPFLVYLFYTKLDILAEIYLASLLKNDADYRNIIFGKKSQKSATTRFAHYQTVTLRRA